MITLIRKNQKTLLIIITLLVIIAFAFLYNSTEMDKLGANNIGTFYGQTLSQTDIDRRARLFNLAAALGFREMLGTLSGQAIGQATNRDEAVMSFVLNGIILEKESERLQLRPTDAEIAAVIRELPVFQTNGVFDLQRYTQFLERTLSPNGMTETQLQEVIRAKLQLERLNKLLGSAAVANPREVRNEWERFNRLYDTSIVRFNLNTFTDQVSPDEQQITEFFQQNKANLMTAEQRIVKAVEFSLTAEQQELTGNESIQALQQLADRAGEFTIAVLEPEVDFEQLAASSEPPLEISQYGPFSHSEPPEKFLQVPEFVRAAFALSDEDPDSDAIQTDNGFVVLHLQTIIPSRPMSLGEAREQIVATLVQQQAAQLMEEAAEAARKTIVAAISEKGVSFADAAIEAGQEATQLAQFSLSNPQLEEPEAAAIFQLVGNLEAGETSEYATIGDSGFLLHIDNTSLPDESVFASEQEQISQALLARKQQIAFYQWLANRNEAANLEGN